mmetsp:Transcript_15046/g.29114  ORF Transcript_15046/g.29114 Transcript_15046/m.29114 type:complete len:249 (-) Transcript_15046:246-992(-)
MRQELLRGCRRVPSRRNDRQPLVRITKLLALKPDVHIALLWVSYVGTFSFHGPVGCTSGWYLHHADDRLLASYQRDVRRKLPVPLDEFLRAVEGVYVPAVRVVLPLAIRHLLVLFAYDGDVWVLVSKRGAYHSVCFQVRFRHRRLVAFGLHSPLLLVFESVHFHDRIPCSAGHTYEVLHVQHIRKVLHIFILAGFVSQLLVTGLPRRAPVRGANELSLTRDACCVLLPESGVKSSPTVCTLQYSTVEK